MSVSRVSSTGEVWILSESFDFDPPQSLIVTVHAVTSSSFVILPLSSSPPQRKSRGDVLTIDEDVIQDKTLPHTADDVHNLLFQ